ncbi:MAG TPA: ABC transporter substrate-binding protein [Mycobacteriales bacterium]|nr:ABC transporter substrate-binding protein [Mycobacteriales bacterium]
MHTSSDTNSTMDLSRRRAIQLAGVTSLAATAAACSKGGTKSSAGGGGSGSTFNAGEPYDAPPKGNLNVFDGILESIPNALNYLYDYILLPGAMYFWKEQKYFYLLADESSSLSADGKTLTYKVRDGITWSDGNKITAKDVYTTSLVGYAMLRPAFSYIDTFEMTDDMTVVYHIGTPAPIAQYYIMRERIVPDSMFGDFAKQAEPLAKAKKPSNDKTMVALNKSISAFKPKTIVASGPINVDIDTVTSNQLTMSKNEKSYLAKTVKFDKVQVYQGETEAITPLMLQQKIDYATQAFPVATEEELVKKGYRILRPPTYSGPAVFFNYDKVPEFADKRARQALAYAINRNENGTVGEGKSGKGVVFMAGLSDTAVPTWISEADQAKLNKYERSADKATQLLKAAGWKKAGKNWLTPQGKQASYELLFPSDYADWSAAAKNLAGQLADFGIKIVLKGEQSVQAGVDVQGSRFTLAIQGWGSSDNPFPADSFRAALFTYNTPQLAPTQKGMNFPMTQTTDIVGKVDLKKVVVEAGIGVNAAALKKNTTTAALAFNELLPVVPLWERYGNNPALVSAVTGYPPDGDPIYDNSPYADNFTAILTFQGKLKPA